MSVTYLPDKDSPHWHDLRKEDLGDGRTLYTGVCRHVELETRGAMMRCKTCATSWPADGAHPHQTSRSWVEENNEPKYGSIVLKNPHGAAMYVSLLDHPGSEHKYQTMIGKNVVRTYTVTVHVTDQVLDLGIADLGSPGDWPKQRHDLIAFLNARLDEDEAAARACGPPPGRLDTGRYFRWGQTDDFIGDETGYLIAYSVQSEAHRGHIARHDPARVLAEVEVKRLLINRYHGQSTLPDGTLLEECETCGAANEAWPCPTLRLLALPYASHPEWRLQWAPSPKEVP